MGAKGKVIPVDTRPRPGAKLVDLVKDYRAVEVVIASGGLSASELRDATAKVVKLATEIDEFIVLYQEQAEAWKQWVTASGGN